MLIVQALPATGKSWLAEHHPSTWVDSDDLLTQVAGDKTKEAFDAMMADDALIAKMADLINVAVVEAGKHLATNFDPTPFGVKPDIIVRVRPEDYVKHIKAVGRDDLLDSFSTGTLEMWAQPREDIPTLFLEPGHHLAELVSMMHLG